jgi:Ni,Fe-hydrogenase I large subunit
MFPELIIEEIKIENLSIADHSFTVDIVPATTSRYIGISHLNGKFSSTLALNLIFNIESEKNYIYNDKPTAATIKDHIIDFYKLFANDFYVEILDNRDEPYQI